MKNNEANEVINRGSRIPYNLQFFAEKDGEGAGDQGGADDQDEGDDDGDEGDDDANPGADNAGEKKFTQADIDAAVEKRLAKERKKMPNKEELAAFREYQKQQKASQGKDDDSKNEELTKAQEENSKLATKVMCLERGVLKDNIDDVVALAMSYVDDDTDIEDAIEKVLKKYPTFTKKQSQGDDEDDDSKQQPGAKSWGQRQEGKGTPKMTGVEAAFYAKNPGLRPKN